MSDISALSRAEAMSTPLDSYMDDIERLSRGKPVGWWNLEIDKTYRTVSAQELYEKNAKTVFLTEPNTKKIHSVAVCSREPDFKSDSLGDHSIDQASKDGLHCFLLKLR